MQKGFIHGRETWPSAKAMAERWRGWHRRRASVNSRLAGRVKNTRFHAICAWVTHFPLGQALQTQLIRHRLGLACPMLRYMPARNGFDTSQVAGLYLIQHCISVLLPGFWSFLQAWNRAYSFITHCMGIFYEYKGVIKIRPIFLGYFWWCFWMLKL